MSNPDDIVPTETQPAPNLSTEHQKPGDARRPSDTLDRDQTPTLPEDGGDHGGRKSSLTKNE